MCRQHNLPPPSLEFPPTRSYSQPEPSKLRTKLINLLRRTLIADFTRSSRTLLTMTCQGATPDVIPGCIIPQKIRTTAEETAGLGTHENEASTKAVGDRNPWPIRNDAIRCCPSTNFVAGILLECPHQPQANFFSGSIRQSRAGVGPTACARTRNSDTGDGLVSDLVL